MITPRANIHNLLLRLRSTATVFFKVSFMAWTHTFEYFAVAKVGGFIYAAIILLFLLTHIVRSLSNREQSETPPMRPISPSRTSRISVTFKNIGKNSSLWPQVLTLTALFSYTANTILYALNTNEILSPMGPLPVSCTAYSHLFTASLNIGKVSTFYLLVLRLRAYDDSTFGYSRPFLIGLLSLVTLWLCATMAWIVLLEEGTWNKEWKYCETDFVNDLSIYLLIGTVACDLLISLITLFLFIRVRCLCLSD